MLVTAAAGDRGIVQRKCAARFLEREVVTPNMPGNWSVLTFSGPGPAPCPAAGCG